MAAKASELEQAATRLKAVGLVEEAESLLLRAAEKRKYIDNAPGPGKHVDILEGFVTT